MVRIFNLVILNLLISFICGCAPNNVFHKKSRGKWVSKESYSLTDTLVVNNYALYNSRAEISPFPDKEPFEIDKDSVVLVLKGSLKNLGMENIRIEFGRNIIDSSLYRQQAVRIRHIRNSYIYDLADNSCNSPALVLMVYAHNQFSFTGFISSGGISGNNGFFILTWLSLFAFIIDEGEIVYSRHIRYKSDQVWADSRKEIKAVPPLAAVKQEHWDELVRLAMEDYIKRLK